MVHESSGHTADFIGWEMPLTEAYNYQRIWIETLALKWRIEVKLKGRYVSHTV